MSVCRQSCTPPKLSVKVVDIWLFRRRDTLDLCTSILWTILPKGILFRWRDTLDLYTPNLRIALPKGTYALTEEGAFQPEDRKPAGQGQAQQGLELEGLHGGLGKNCMPMTRSIFYIDVLFAVMGAFSRRVGEGKCLESCSQ